MFRLCIPISSNSLLYLCFVFRLCNVSLLNFCLCMFVPRTLVFGAHLVVSMNVCAWAHTLYTKAKTLWDALVTKFEENLEIRNNKKGMLKGEVSMFNHVQDELIVNLMQRFEALITKFKSASMINLKSMASFSTLFLTARTAVPLQSREPLIFKLPELLTWLQLWSHLKWMKN